MELEDIDRILSESDTLEPSSGLALRITEAIHRQAAEPAQPRFPWLRFSLGLAACVLMALFGMKIVMRCAPVLSTLKETFAPVVELAPNLAWAFAAVLGGLGLSFLLRYVARYYSMSNGVPALTDKSNQKEATIVVQLFRGHCAR